MTQKKNDNDRSTIPPVIHNENPGRNEFYIGWQPEAPLSFARHVKKTLIAAAFLFVFVSVSLALFQKKFGTGNFEFGKLTQVKGFYFNKPVPNIKVVNGRDIFGNLSYITILLVGYGKSGATGILAEIEKKRSVSFDAKEITMKGTLLYNDGKTLMQIDAIDEPVVTVGAIADNALLPVQKDLGKQTIKGEIIDPKCYFGVMKPGEGKPHKDCAIRCILGGIPPVFHVRNEKGESNYYLIVGPDGEKMNEAVKDFVAEPVTINANVTQYDDWIILYMSGREDVRSYSFIGSHLSKQALSCSVKCFK